MLRSLIPGHQTGPGGFVFERLLPSRLSRTGYRVAQCLKPPIPAFLLGSDGDTAQPTSGQGTDKDCKPCQGFGDSQRRRTDPVRRARALTGDGDEGMGGRGGGLEPSTAASPLLLAHEVGLPSAALGVDGAPAAQRPAVRGEVRVPPRQERGIRGLQVPGPHPGVRRAGQPPPSPSSC